MSEWALRRFWTAAEVTEAETGYSVTLDGRSVRTPAKAQLIVPTRAMAVEIAAEWQAQDGAVDPTTMPFTRSANAAIDKVRPQREEVARMLADYGDSDLLCYRADAPEGLVARQAEIWDPYLDWAASALGARLEPRTGLMHAPQDAGALAVLSDRTHAFGPFELAAFHDLVSLTGSLVLGFAAVKDHAAPDDIWAASRVDEDWQIEQWGEDEEAAEAAAVKRAAFLHAKRFFDAAR